jgi:hypothetical protein
VVLFTSLLAVLVMGGVVLLAQHGAREEARERGPFAGLDLGPGPPSPFDLERTAWPDEACVPRPGFPAAIAFDLGPEGLDFGHVKQDVTLTRTVTFRNGGTGTLCIRRVETGCGCVKARLTEEGRRYEPGEEGTIELVLDSKGRMGPQRKSVSVYTNAPASPIARFEVRADVSVGLIAFPAILDFGRAAVDTPRDAMVTLRSTKDVTDWSVVEIVGRAPPEGGEPTRYAFVEKASSEGEHHLRNLTVTHPGRATLGLFRDTVTLRTTHPERAELSLEVVMNVLPAILPTPPRISLGYVSSRDTRQQRVTLVPAEPGITYEVVGFSWKGRDGAPLDPPPPFTVTKGKDEEGRWYVDVAYDGQVRPEQHVSAVLVVETDRPREGPLEIPCFATVKEG